MTSDPDLATSFDRAADTYERARPGYPSEAVAWLVASGPADVGAQMWHWVDADRAIPEVRRVLRPGGTLGLIWNVRDESVPWVGELGRIIKQSAAERYIDTEAPIPATLGEVETLVVDWTRPFDRQGLLDLVASRSYVIAATADDRERILREVGDLVDSHPDLADPASWEMPYRTEAFRVRVG